MKHATPLLLSFLLLSCSQSPVSPSGVSALAIEVAYPVSGYVREQPGGQPVVGARVGALSGDSRTVATTDAHGRYTLGLVPAGPVRLTASAPGYRPTVVRGAIDGPTLWSVYLARQ